MVRKVFDVDCKEHVKSIFDILNSVFRDINTIFLRLDGWWDLKFDGNMRKVCDPSALRFIINWNDKTKITRPVDESEWIGQPCWFWNKGWSNTNDKVVGILKEIVDDRYYTTNMQHYYDCRPLTKAEWAKYEPKN